MIETRCACGAALSATEAHINRSARCPACSRSIRYVSAEPLERGAGGGDFDASLSITSGPSRIGECLFIGGVMEIQLGKLPERHILLDGGRVSRHHATLRRLDFGPSRWEIVDNRSTNGLFVNGRRVQSHELRDGDIIRIGDFDLHYHVVQPAPATVPPPLPAGARLASSLSASALLSHDGTGPTCPSCEQRLEGGAQICVGCGIDVRTGRPILTSKGFDEEDLKENAEKAIRVISWPVPLGFYPIASEAFGTVRPMATWVICGITVLCSLLFLGAGCGSDVFELSPGSGFMLWPIEQDPVAPADADDMSPFRRFDQDPQRFSYEEFERSLRAMIATHLPRMDFAWYQLFTHALLHADLFHLAGNMLFLLVFGTRVNALIGNFATAVLYPILAASAAMAQQWYGTDPSFPIPMLGASGAVMGMAGLYLILFPLHRVFMAIWARWCMLFLPLIIYLGFYKSWTVFALRGIWVVLFFIAWDVLYASLRLESGVAHWAHLGGFIAGAGIALVLLLTRMVNARGGDILSVTLGRHAWPLIGKPSRWRGTDVTSPPDVVITRYPTA